MKPLKIIFFFTLLSLSTFSCAMDSTITQISKPYLALRTLDVRDKLHALLQTANTAECVTLSADLAFITNQKVIDLIKAIASKKQGSVSLHLDADRHENQHVCRELKDCKNITLKRGSQHGKRVLIAYKKTGEQTWHYSIYEGSYNPNNAQRCRRQNFEIGLITHDNHEYYKQHLASHVEGMQEDANGAHILPPTELKCSTVYDTTLYKLTESLAQQINPEKGGTLYLGTMGYGNTTLHAKLLVFCKQGGTVHMIVDWEFLTKVSTQLLSELTQAGAHITVAKTNNQKNMKGNFHRKCLVRLTDNRTVDLVVIQSENFVNRATPVFNHASYHPNNPELGQAIIAHHVYVANHTSSKTLAQVINDKSTHYTDNDHH